MNVKKFINISNSWKELNKNLEKLTKSNRSKVAGDIFEYLTKLYLETAPQYKSKLKKVYLLKDVPTNIKNNVQNTVVLLSRCNQTIDIKSIIIFALMCVEGAIIVRYRTYIIQ